MFAPLFDGLADGGRMVVYSVLAGREASLDLFALYRRRISVLGLSTAIVDAARGAAILDELAPLFESGAVQPLPVAARFPLAEAVAAYERVAGRVPGKVVLEPWA